MKKLFKTFTFKKEEESIFFSTAADSEQKP